jgi:ribosomal protein S12 methylthiotransferase
MLRGRYRSKPVEQILGEADALVRSGAKEISLTAQDSTSYGIDLYGKPCLHSLLKRLVKIKGIKWLRIMYVHPDKIDVKILNVIKIEPRICKYLDMPLQHISDRVLVKMNRKSTEKGIKNTIEKIRGIIPDIAIRTNFIVGFPGETDKDFKKLLDFARETRFDNVGIFKYCRERKTKVWHFRKQVPEKIKNEKFNELLKVQSKVIDELNGKLIGKKVKILLDASDSGRTQGDAPDIDGRIEIINSSGLKSGMFVHVQIISGQGYVRQANVVSFFLKNFAFFF